jgi:hypothetical protein
VIREASATTSSSGSRTPRCSSAEVRELADLPSVLLQQVEDLFVNYQKVRDVEVTPLGRKGPESAKRTLEAAAS